MSFIKNNELIRSFFIYGLTSGLSRFISLLLIPIYVRFFSVSDYGIIDMIQTIVQISMIFGILQLETSIQRYYFEMEESEKKKMVSSVSIVVFLLSVFISFALSLFASSLSQWLFKTKNYSFDIIIASWIIPLLNLSILNFIILRYEKKTFAFSFTTVLQILLTAGITIFLVVKLKWGIKSVFIGQIFGYFGVIVIQYFYIKKSMLWCVNKEILKKMFVFALPQLPARIGSISTNNMNRFILITYISTMALGLYAVAVKFSCIIILIDSAFTMAWMPYMYESLKKGDYKEKFRSVYKYVVLFTFYAIICMSLFSTEIIGLFTVPEYFNAKYLLSGLFLYNGLYIIIGVVNIGPSISKKMIYTTYIYLSVAALNIIFLIIGVKLLELKGIVYALILTNFCLLLFNWYTTEKLHPIGFKIKPFIVLFILSSFIILILMNFDIKLIYRIMFCLFMSVAFLKYLIKSKKAWEDLLSLKK